MTVAIATPFSHQFADADVRASIEALSDMLELRTPAQASDSDGDVLFHCEFSLVVPWGKAEFLELRQMAAGAGGRLKAVSFHALSRYLDNDLVDGAFVGKGAPMDEATMLANACNNVRMARGVFGQILFMVENNNHLGTDAYDGLTSAAFISELMDAAGLDLLLDIAHARITARNTGVTEEAYLAGLPLGRVRQVHLSGHGEREDGTFFDAHEPVTEDDFTYFMALRDRLPALEYVTVEYYKDAASLLSQLRALRRIIKG